MATIFTDKLADGFTKRFKAGDVELIDWYRDKAQQTTYVNPTKVINSRKAKPNAVNQPTIGKMLFYGYDPKHKATLPYYDKFPLIFPIEKYSDGFLGINLHYLPPVYRARLMDALYDTMNNKRYDDSSRLILTYKLLKNASKFRYFKPCIKRYLTSHIRTNMVEIPVEEWDYVMFLPLARFEKMSQRKVWDESIATIMGK